MPGDVNRQTVRAQQQITQWLPYSAKCDAIEAPAICRFQGTAYMCLANNFGKLDARCWKGEARRRIALSERPHALDEFKECVRDT